MTPSGDLPLPTGSGDGRDDDEEHPDDHFEPGNPLRARPLDEDDTFLIPKAFCHGCDYISRPPKVECTYDDSRIIHEDRYDFFKVNGCPRARSETAIDPET